MNKNVTVNLQPLGKTISVIKGTPLLDFLHEFGVEFPCGGKGTCGSCKVKLLKGELEIDAVQQEKIKKLHLEKHWRLACFCRAESDIELEITQFENIILADNSSFEFQAQNKKGCVFPSRMNYFNTIPSSTFY